MNYAETPVSVLTKICSTLITSLVISFYEETRKHQDLQATVEKIDVFRGLPSVDIEPNAYARNLAQQQHWHEQREVTVHHRPLQYEFHRDADGRKLRDGHGKLMATGEKREKGIDVLCALAMVRNTLDPGIDVVILASRDSDLAPALDECHNLKSAKVESCTWVDYDRRYTLGTLKTSAKLWNTRMDRLNFEKSLDRNHYN